MATFVILILINEGINGGRCKFPKARYVKSCEKREMSHQMGDVSILDIDAVSFTEI